MYQRNAPWKSTKAGDSLPQEIFMFDENKLSESILKRSERVVKSFPVNTVAGKWFPHTSFINHQQACTVKEMLFLTKANSYKQQCTILKRYLS